MDVNTVIYGGMYMKEKTKLTVCGARGAYPLYGENYREFGFDTTCYILRRGKVAIIADCGTGLTQARAAAEGCDSIDALITHYHYDHIAGLLTAGWLTGSARFFVPECADPVAAINGLSREPYWPVPLGIDEKRVIPVTAGNEFDCVLGRVSVRPARHPGGGNLYRADTADGTVCFLFDHEQHDLEELAGFAAGADIIVYDGMYTEAEAASGKYRNHSSAAMGARLAKLAGAKRLVLTHHAPFHDDAALMQIELEARSIFENSVCAREGGTFTL